MALGRTTFTIIGAAVMLSTSVGYVAERPVLGASREVFVSQLGTPVRETSDFADFMKCPGRTAVAEWSISFSSGKASAITKNACPGTKHDTQQALTEARLIMPSDAVRGAAFVASDGWNARAYHSRGLAKLLPKESARACKGAAAPAGSFFYLLSPERSMWMVAAGLCP